MYGFGHDPEVPAGYQDADLEMRELEEQANDPHNDHLDDIDYHDKELETYTINGPVPYDGPLTRDQVHRTHQWWVAFPDEARECAECMAKEGSISAGWPCGYPIPRKNYEVKR